VLVDRALVDHCHGADVVRFDIGRGGHKATMIGFMS
jgi:hypothetical protein